jgi:hypothetical protein
VAPEPSNPEARQNQPDGSAAIGTNGHGAQASGGNFDAYRSTDMKTWTHLVVK